MEINIDDDKKLVEVWLTSMEKNDSALRASLPPLYREFKDKGYLVAVFESGAGDLSGNTLSLLLHNREALAKQALETANQESA